ncbi:hypothetical protein [Nonomuraea sp. NPDC049400]
MSARVTGATPAPDAHAYGQVERWSVRLSPATAFRASSTRQGDWGVVA